MTVLFTLIFAISLVFFVKKDQQSFLSKKVTNQLKGLAILTVVFSHIGYFLFPNTNFLFPLSALGGVGVNLFLFLSGFGLTRSELDKPLSVLSFYKKRLIKLFIPLWLILTVVLLADYFFLHRAYQLEEILHSFLGFYPKADVGQNIDSPLWYFSIIFFYYLIFPLLFTKKIPLLSPILILITSILILKLPLAIDPDVVKLYKLHFLAFPLGVAFGQVIDWVRFKLNQPLRFLILTAALLIFSYTTFNSNVGQGIYLEQNTSLITALSAVVILSLANLDFKLLSLFGAYSYYIYLFHWPILSRFNLFLTLPPFLDTVLNLILFIVLGYILQKAISKILKILNL